MKKIPSIFIRDMANGGKITEQPNPDAAWVFAGEGTPTIKYDGTSVLIRGGKLYKRYDAKRGKVPPPGFEPAQEPDPNTGHHPGWLPVGDGPEDQWHREAWEIHGHGLPDGTYELCGPKVQGNPEGLAALYLLRHGDPVSCPARCFGSLRDWFTNTQPVEGIVWHHPDGRMAKIKRRDFGLPWPATPGARSGG